MDWMLLPFKRYVDFEGRSRRTEYWMFQLLLAVVYMVLLGLMFLGVAMGSEQEPGGLFWVGLVLVVLFALGTFLPALAVQVRRFHDQDKSGWFVLLGFIPWVGGLIVLIFMCLRGTIGPNRFGEDPLTD
ncbi:DUF805 domain-containing protein [Flavobacterium sp. MXW15]|uniref:DUF805 domain-containing protein n=1 Tax=Xanthomonas chitinilytica TaxID=2989819 RepID=A0ABT3JVJ5_9XANT|nr:DUF805 domain-containing protein [Xanthomonas sp. H13-6]MCW4454854.1 DUF805 domain-containing protein [Flavobacterium sp. MXW15]MCW4472518.1 DUF805 domain-containing protein [Xanthomonas sp. H13-6]